MSKFNTTNQTPNYGEQPEAQPKKKIGTGWKIAGAAVVVFAAIGIFAPTGDDDSSNTPTTEAQPTSTTATVAEQTDNDAPAPTPTDEPVTNSDDDNGSWLSDLTSSESHTLRFEADTSDGSNGMVTYVGKDFNIIQAADQPMPWSAEQTDIDSKFDVLGANVSAQQDGSGEVTCRIFWDGEVVAENTSTGPYAVVSCSLPSGL